METTKIPKNLDNSTLKKSFYWWRGDKLQYYMELWGAGLSSVGTPKTKFLGYINFIIWKAPHPHHCNHSLHIVTYVTCQPIIL